MTTDSSNDTSVNNPKTVCPAWRQESFAIEAEDEIDFLELWEILRKNRRLIFGMIFVVSLISVVAAFSIKPVYRVEALLAPASQGGEGSRGISALASQFGGLAGLAGISLPGGGDTETTLATIKSRKFLANFIREKELKPVLFHELWDDENKTWRGPGFIQKIKNALSLSADSESLGLEKTVPGEPTIADAYNYFSEILTVERDTKTSLIKLSIDWEDPVVAAEWANELTRRVNDTLRLEAMEESAKSIEYLKKEIANTSLSDLRAVLYRLIEEHTKNMVLAKVTDEYALKVIDPATPSQEPVWPRKKLIILLGIMFGGGLGVMMVFIRNAFERRKTVSRAYVPRN